MNINKQIFYLANVDYLLTTGRTTVRNSNLFFYKHLYQILLYKYIRLTNIYYAIESTPGNKRRKIEEREVFKHVTLYEEMEMKRKSLDGLGKTISCTEKR